MVARRVLAAIAMAAAVSGAVSVSRGAYQAIDLTGALTQAQGVAASGGGQGGSGNNAPILWSGTAGSAVPLNTPGNVSATLSALSPTMAVGTRSNGAQTTAIVWTHPSTNSTDLPLLDVNSHLNASSEGLAADPSGISTVGGTADGKAALWVNLTLYPLHPAGPTYDTSRVLGISGATAVGSATQGDGTTKAALWNITNPAAPVFSNITPATMDSAAANAISGNQIAGLASTAIGPQHAFLWDLANLASPVDLQTGNLINLYSSSASGTNGSVQVGSGQIGDGDGPLHAVIWTGTGASAVDLHGTLSGLGTFTDSAALGIDSFGNIVGWALDSDFKMHAVLWTSVPEPRSLAIFAGAGWGLLVRRRKM